MMIAISPKTEQTIDELWALHKQCGEVTTYDISQIIGTTESPTVWLKRMKRGGQDLPPIIHRNAYGVKARQQAARLRELYEDGIITRRDAESVLGIRGSRLEERLESLRSQGIDVPKIGRNRPERGEAGADLTVLQRDHERAIILLHNERLRWGKPSKAAYELVERLEAAIMKLARGQ
jgi:hypothetical protein